MDVYYELVPRHFGYFMLILIRIKVFRATYIQSEVIVTSKPDS